MNRVALLVLAVVVVVILVSRRQSGPSIEAGDPAFDRALSSGRAAYESGDAAKAAAEFRRAVARDPSQPEARLTLANALLLAGDLPGATTEAAAVIGLDPRSAAAHFVLGSALLRQSRHADAVKSLQTAWDLDKSVAAAALQLGRAYAALQRLDDATLAFNNATTLEPANPFAGLLLGETLLRTGRTNESNAALERHRTLAAGRPPSAPAAADFERCVHTAARPAFRLSQPRGTSVPFSYEQTTDNVFGEGHRVTGPNAVIDIGTNGPLRLFARTPEGYRLFNVKAGAFVPTGQPLLLPTNVVPRRAIAGALQGRRIPDVVLFGEGSTHVLRIQPDSSLRDITAEIGLAGLRARDGALVDFDATGRLDLLVLTETNRPVLFRDAGDGIFRDITSQSGIPADAVASLRADAWNADGSPDIILGRYGQPPALLVSQRGGPFILTNAPVDWPASSLFAIGDLDNDLRPDFVGVLDGTVEIRRSDGQRFTLVFDGSSASRLEFIDYDNDGWLDILLLGRIPHLWRNLGKPGFNYEGAPTSINTVGSGPWINFVSADFDGDGDSDIILESHVGRLMYICSEGAHVNGLLKLHLLGTRSNPDGLGARIELRGPGLRITRTVSRLPIEIGVGKLERIDSITVHWPDIATSLRGLKPDLKPIVIGEPPRAAPR